MFVLEKSLGCLSLRTGGLIIGWVGIIGAAIGAACCFYSLVLSFAGFVIENSSAVQCGDGVVINYLSTLKVRSAICLVFLLIGVQPSVFLVIGIYKNRRSFLYPWLVLSYVGITIIVLSLTLHVFLLNFWGALFTLAIIAISVYAHFIVHSLRLEMVETSESSILEKYPVID